MKKWAEFHKNDKNLITEYSEKVKQEKTRQIQSNSEITQRYESKTTT